MTVTLDDVRAAASRIGSGIARTPCVRSRTLSAITGADVYLKLENMQFTASFKERSALAKLLALSADERARGVIAMSAGNHAQAVAYHGARLGIATTIVMPRTAPFTKIRNTERHGARVVLAGEGYDEAARSARAEAEAQRLTLVHPYDDPAIIAGQGTVALEMLEDVPALEMLVVPVGGGGLIAGVATAARALRPAIEVIGVEAALYPSMQAAIAGRAVTAEGATLADGIAVKEPGAHAVPIVRALVADILLVEEEAIEHGVQLLVEIEKIVAEGAGATPLAALLAHPARFAGRTVGLVISGGNIDSWILASVLMRGLVRAGRLVRLQVELPDHPGSLARATRLVGELGGNIVEVAHERWFRDVPVRLAVIDALVEVMDIESATAIVAGLNAAGMPARLATVSGR
ncbi:MAG: threonine ammonia-lyase [Alphaproteobacteria bacterium]|nr:threonine ammonia-lyase [Alphaproteobacteria bacterium]